MAQVGKDRVCCEEIIVLGIVVRMDCGGGHQRASLASMIGGTAGPNSAKSSPRNSITSPPPRSGNGGPTGGLAHRAKQQQQQQRLQKRSSRSPSIILGKMSSEAAFCAKLNGSAMSASLANGPDPSFESIGNANQHGHSPSGNNEDSQQLTAKNSEHKSTSQLQRQNRSHINHLLQLFL